MKCPKCNGTDLPVQDTRFDDAGVRRRRVCAGCGVRYVTVETIDAVYVSEGRGRPKSARRDKPKPEPKPKVTKAIVKRQAAARRKVEDLMDEREDYSVYDDLSDAGIIWK